MLKYGMQLLLIIPWVVVVTVDVVVRTEMYHNVHHVTNIQYVILSG